MMFTHFPVSVHSPTPRWSELKTGFVMRGGQNKFDGLRAIHSQRDRVFTRNLYFLNHLISRLGNHAHMTYGKFWDYFPLSSCDMVSNLPTKHRISLFQAVPQRASPSPLVRVERERPLQHRQLRSWGQMDAIIRVV